MRANLWLRTASRVLVRVARFRATEFYEVENRAKRIPWQGFLAPGASAEFRVTARKSKLYHSDAIAERLASGVSSRLKDAGGDGQPAAPAAPDRQLFVVRVYRDEFTISADASGGLLHMRGYRQAVAKAPLRETLAAALLLANAWNGDVPLLDPLCGSGTIPIEGALIARRIAPGARRLFAFMRWPSFEPAEWRGLLDEAQSLALASSPIRILGSDRDAGGIESARSNAERAGVAGDVEFSVRAISAIEPPAERGLLATNPPYGKRVGHRSNVGDLYAQLGNVARERCRGWRIAMYSPDARLAKQTALPFREALRTSNGGIKVALIAAEVPDSAASNPTDRG